MVDEIRGKLKQGDKIAFVSGNFNVVHPGHIRLLNFASECADFVVVGVHPDGQPDTFVPQLLRLEGVKAIGFVDYACILDGSLQDFLSDLKPEIVVKGQEHESLSNPELAVVESYGGELIFASGEIWFSSLNLLKEELKRTALPSLVKPMAYLERHKTSRRRLSEIAKRFSDLHVVVLGDLIIDEYVFCNPLGMSQEDPTIVVTPVKRDLFIGGAGIVAAHGRSLGAQVDFLSVVGNDATAGYARGKLQEYGVNATLLVDESRPTTLKQRFRVQNKTLLRVSELRQHSMSHELQMQMVKKIKNALATAQLLVFSDFSYGCLPQRLIDEISEFCLQKRIPMVADSQSSSQIGDITRFKNTLLITPTEREARLAIRDPHFGLTAVADMLRKKTDSKHVFITLGSEGLLIHSPGNGEGEMVMDELPVFNSHPKDTAGAGDCLLICASMALVAGATIWESAYLGSIAAGCQVGRVGNLPLMQSELLKELIE